jgi:hypothetical protein
MGGLFPRKTMLDAVDGAYANAVCSRDLLEGFPVLKMIPNFDHLLFRELGLMVFSAVSITLTPSISNRAERTLVSTLIRSASTLLTTLTNHILHVIGMTTEKQMLRVDANRVVTPMEDLDTIRDGASKQVVGNTMPTMNFDTIFNNLYRRVAAPIKSILPLPTTTSIDGVTRMKTLNKPTSNHNEDFSGGITPHYTEVGRIF